MFKKIFSIFKKGEVIPASEPPIKRNPIITVEIGEYISPSSLIKKKISLWEILKKDICPNCGTKGKLEEGLIANISMNVRCSECNQMFRKTSIKEIGAFYIGSQKEVKNE
jgi:predicted Zn finger-like uncharacterized protein